MNHVQELRRCVAAAQDTTDAMSNRYRMAIETIRRLAHILYSREITAHEEADLTMYIGSMDADAFNASLRFLDLRAADSMLLTYGKTFFDTIYTELAFLSYDSKNCTH